MTTPDNDQVAVLPDKPPHPAEPPASSLNLHEPIRLLYVISSLEHGGAEHQVIELANRLNPQRFDVNVAVLEPHVPLAHLLRDRDRRLHVVEKRWKFDTGVIRRLAKFMRAKQTQIVHAFLFDAEMAARWAARSAGAPLVVSSERNSDYVMPRVHWLCKRVTRSWFDVMIANSEAGKRFNMRKLGINGERIDVIRNGIDTQRFQLQDKAAARKALDLPAHAPIVGMVATFKRQKNHGDFLRAAERLHNQYPDALFACIGEPMRANQQGAQTYHGEIVDLLDTLSVKSKCRFLGKRNDMPVVYNALDILVLPSTHEGTPNVLLEGMACGTPVVANDVSDNAQIAPDGKVGFIVQLGDVDALTERIGRLLENQTLRQTFSTAAREWVEHEFSMDKLIERTSRSYQRALLRACQAGKRRPALEQIAQALQTTEGMSR
jgi:glycosyltransferase involved in cell wall biosynthesis